MEVMDRKKVSWKTKITELGEVFEKRAVQYDREGSFVHENYKELKTAGFFSAAIPKALGGAGVSHKEMGQLLKQLARYCGSTALAASMHQHLIAAAVWKYKNQGEGEEFLKHVAKHELVLVSTGARDWLGSNGTLEKVAGGYMFSASKHFASQAPGGDLAVTSGKKDPGEVLHFNVPLSAPGVKILDNWNVMGMRATGSQSIVFENVFVPESAVTLSRFENEYHPVWNVVLTLAVPLIMSVYTGLAEKAFEIAVEKGSNYHRNQPHIATLLGRMHTILLNAQTGCDAMFTLANEYEFAPEKARAVKVLGHKTNVEEAAKKVVTCAMEALGGQSFLRSNALERLFRDVQASAFHPLPKWEQYAFSGQFILENNTSVQ